MLGRQQPPGLFSGLVVIARAKHPIPSRTRPLSAVAPMVLRLKTWESRSPPNLKRDTSLINDTNTPDRQRPSGQTCQNPAQTVAGWSSPVARQAHNLKVTGSNPVPATKKLRLIKDFKAEHNARLLSFQILVNTWSTFYEAPLRGGLLRYVTRVSRQDHPGTDPSDASARAG